MRITKRIILIILSALLVLSVVACGKAEENPKGEENTPPVEQDPPAQEEPPSEEEEPGQEDPKDEFVRQTLTEELKKEIADAIYATGYPEGSNLPGYAYYGTYSGYAVLYFPSVFDKPHSISLHPYDKKYSICAGYYFEMYAYKDGSFFPIEEICKPGILTLEDREAIVRHHYR